MSVHSGTSHDNHAALESRAVDMIVAAEATDTADWVEAHPLAVDPYILVCAPDIPEDATLETLMASGSSIRR